MLIECKKDYSESKGLFSKDRITIMRQGNVYEVEFSTSGESNNQLVIFYGEDSEWHQIYLRNIQEYIKPHKTY